MEQRLRIGACCLLDGYFSGAVLLIIQLALVKVSLVKLVFLPVYPRSLSRLFLEMTKESNLIITDVNLYRHFRKKKRGEILVDISYPQVKDAKYNDLMWTLTVCSGVSNKTLAALKRRFGVQYASIFFK